MGRRVVITGVGYISPIGESFREVKRNITESIICETFIKLDRDIKGRVIDDFEIKKYTGRDKKVKYLNRGAALSVAAAIKAFESSRLNKGIERAGVVISSGPNFDFGNEIESIDEGGISKKGLNALWMLRFLPNTASTIIASKTGFTSENAVISSACASSLSAIGEAYRKVKDGYLDTVLTGGGDSRVNRGGLLAYEMAGALSRTNHMRPFDKMRDGFIAGEGAGFLMLEELDHALNRNAEILGEVKGYGVTLDTGSMTAPDPTGSNAKKAAENALDDAGFEPSDIDFISSHGTGTNLNDDVEAKVISEIFGEKTAVISIKSWSGHLSTACGAFETALSIDFMRDGFLPGIRNLDNPISGINLNKENKNGIFDSFAIQNYGFGGQNCSMIVTKWKE